MIYENETFEGVFRIKNDYFLRVYNTKTQKSSVRKIDPEWKLFIPDKNGEYTYITDENLKMKEIIFTKKNDFINALKTYETVNVSVSKIDPELNVVYKHFWNKTPVPQSNIWYLDIEAIDLNNRVFPNVIDHSAPVTHIQILNSKTNSIYILMTKDIPKDIKEQYPDVKFIVLKTEKMLFEAFFRLLDLLKPTIIGAWNGDYFDFPYLTLRAESLGLNINKFSPLKKVTKKEVENYGKKEIMVTWEGLYLIDLLQAYKKFTYSDQKSFSLEYTSQKVLGEGNGKVDYGEYKSIYDFYERNYSKFTEYAIQDVVLLKKIDDEIGLTNLLIMMGNMMGCNINDIFGTVKPWTTYLTLLAYKDKKVIPLKSNSSSGKSIMGGWVKDPVIGKHLWEVSIDYNSMYPANIVSLNISPDTYIPYENLPDECKNIIDYFEDEDESKLLYEVGIEDRIKKICKKYDISFAGCGFYKKDKIGLIPDVVNNIYVGRKKEKEKYLLAEALLGKLEENS